MTRFRAAVATNVQVVAILGRNQADVLSLGFRTFADATGNGHLDLVRRADPLVAVLHTNREADRILYPVPAPTGADAALHGSQRFGIGVAALETGVYQFLPDLGQILHAG